MKSFTQAPKSSSSTTNVKSKKTGKDKDKKKSAGMNSDTTNHSGNEKGSPSKEYSSRQYTGIDLDLISTYAEQCTAEHLSEDISNILTEDINYRLRYIINDALIKARLGGRNAINSGDLGQTFESLNIDKVYGAPLAPNWITFSHQNLYCLDDNIVNLVELTEKENAFIQPYECILKKTWLPEQKELSKPLKKYFITMCQCVVSKDLDIRRTALLNIRTNCRIGPIIEYFYNFGYTLLSKDITYDCLTLRALDLITILEYSLTCRTNVSGKMVKLLVRLLLQRLLKSFTPTELLKPMATVLAILCHRLSLRDFVISKVSQKLLEIYETYSLAIVTIVNCLGVEAIKQIFLPNKIIFLERIGQTHEVDLPSAILHTFNIMSRENLLDNMVYNDFYNIFGEILIMFQRYRNFKIKESEKLEINIVKIKINLIMARRRIPGNNSKSKKWALQDVFDIPPGGYRIKKKNKFEFQINYPAAAAAAAAATDVTVGKANILLPLLQSKNDQRLSKCYDHSLIFYNI